MKIGIGIVLILLSLFNISSLPDWSTAELVGFNAFTSGLILTGLYLIYKGYKERNA